MLRPKGTGMVDGVACQLPPTRDNASNLGMHRDYDSYPTYRPTGVEWLGEIPAHWGMLKLKHAATLNPRMSKVRRLAPDTKVSFVPMETVGEYGGLDLTLTKELADVADGFTYFSDGDVLVAKITPCFENGKGTLAEGLLNGIAFGTTELHIVRCGPELDKRFTFYLTLGDAFRKLGAAEMYGAGGQKRVPESFVADLKHPIPPLAEQRAIAAFLDRETAKIDSLVAKKERLIELLQEKRTVLISQAVTKGLGPDVPMKDSGVEWLGQIPANWEVKRLKHVAGKIGSGKTPKGGADRYLDDGIMLVRSQNVHFGGLRLTDVAYIDVATDSEMSGSRVKEGDVLLNITGASLGRCCIAYLGGSDANVNQHVCIVRPDQQRDDPSFLAYSMESHSVQDQIFNNENGVSRDALNFEQIGDLVLARPSMVEQRAIASLLDCETAKLVSLIAKVREAIDRLKELRAALISAAVTGRIDVREEAA